MSKIYTKTGDHGETGLFGGTRLPKDDARIEAIGTVDELNAALGVARVSVNREPKTVNRSLDTWLATVQSQLFELGAELASPAGEHRLLTDAHVTALEHEIDAWQAVLPALSHFILPGGSPLGAELHRARAVCRRAERRVVTLAQADRVTPLRPLLKQYLNRLADALFVAARTANHTAGAVETIWEGRRKNS